MTDNNFPNLPPDPIGIGEELEAMLAVAAEHFNDEQLTPQEIQEFERYDQACSRVVKALEEHGVAFGLSEGQTLEDAEYKATDEMYNKVFLAKITANMVIYVEEDDTALVHVIAKIMANPGLSDEERTAYFSTVESIVGTDSFKEAISSPDYQQELELALEDEQELSASAAESTRAHQLVASILVAAGIAFDHDDFEPFMQDYVTLSRLRSLGAPESITDPIFDKLIEKAHRLGIPEAPELLNGFGFPEE